MPAIWNILGVFTLVESTRCVTVSNPTKRKGPNTIISINCAHTGRSFINRFSPPNTENPVLLISITKSTTVETNNPTASTMRRMSANLSE